MNILNKTACLDGFVIHPANKRELKEGLILLIKKAFEELNLIKLVVEYVYNNIYANDIWDTLRFVHEGILRDQIIVKSSSLDIQLKELLKHEYDRYFHNQRNISHMLLC